MSTAIFGVTKFGLEHIEYDKDKHLVQNIDVLDAGEFFVADLLYELVLDQYVTFGVLGVEDGYNQPTYNQRLERALVISLEVAFMDLILGRKRRILGNVLSICAAEAVNTAVAGIISYTKNNVSLVKKV